MNKKIRPIGILLAVPALLLVPFIAMRFTDEVHWTAMDFLTMGAMLLVTGFAIEAALRAVRTSWRKAAAVFGILVCFVMLWGTLVHMGG